MPETSPSKPLIVKPSTTPSLRSQNAQLKSKRPVGELSKALKSSHAPVSHVEATSFGLLRPQFNLNQKNDAQERENDRKQNGSAIIMCIPTIERSNDDTESTHLLEAEAAITAQMLEPNQSRRSKQEVLVEIEVTINESSKAHQTENIRHSKADVEDNLPIRENYTESAMNDDNVTHIVDIAAPATIEKDMSIGSTAGIDVAVGTDPVISGDRVASFSSEQFHEKRGSITDNIGTESLHDVKCVEYVDEFD
jgi:hypothetical protein